MLQHSVVLTWLKTHWFGKNVWLIFIEMYDSRWKLDGGLIFTGAELLWAILFNCHYQNWEFELGVEVQAIHNAAPQPVLHLVQQPHMSAELLWLPKAAVQGTPMWHTHLYTHFLCEWSERKWVGNSDCPCGRCQCIGLLQEGGPGSCFSTRRQTALVL